MGATEGGDVLRLVALSTVPIGGVEVGGTLLGSGGRGIAVDTAGDFTGAIGSTAAVGGMGRPPEVVGGPASTEATGADADVAEVRPAAEGWGTHIRPWHFGQKAYCPAICSGAERLVWQRGQSIVMGITIPL